MKTTTKEMCITKFIVAKDTKIAGIGEGIVYKKGRVLDIIRNRRGWYHPTNRTVVFGHGITDVIPAENIKAVWEKETTKTVITTKKIAYKAK
jgi:hypothetical protein